MASNNRVFYPCQDVGIAPFTNTSYTTVRGVGSISMNTKFNLEYIYELGQLATYFIAEGIPEVELTLSRVLDGYAPAYTLLTQGAVASTLVGRSTARANMALGIFADSNSTASGNQHQQCTLSGVYCSSVSYTFNTSGAFKESVGIVGNNKIWSTGSFTYTGHTTAMGVTSLAPAAAEGVDVRKDFDMANSRWPTQIPGIDVSGVNNAVAGSGYAAHIQQVSVSATLGRENLLELARKAPFFRFVNFPVAVTCNIEVLNTQGDGINMSETGVLSYGNNLVSEHIFIKTAEGTQIDLGSNNKCVSINETGGDPDARGNSTITYQYQNQSEMDVKHPADPTVALRP